MGGGKEWEISTHKERHIERGTHNEKHKERERTTYTHIERHKESARARNI